MAAEMEGCVEEDADMHSDYKSQHCIICCEDLSDSASIQLSSRVGSVPVPTFLGVDDNESSANHRPKRRAKPSVYGINWEIESRSVKTALSAILQPLRHPIPVGDVLCRPCCLLVVRVDSLRAQADSLEALLLERLDRGEVRVMEQQPTTKARDQQPAPKARARPGEGEGTKAGEKRRRPGRPPKVRPPETESQNYIAAAPSSARRPVSGSGSNVVSIEIRQEDGKQDGAGDCPAGKSTTSGSQGEQESDTAADESRADSPAPAAAAARAKTAAKSTPAAAKATPAPAQTAAAAVPSRPPPPIDPPPTYVRQEQTSQCGVCDLVLDTRVACREHMVRVHQGKKIYFCPLCPVAVMARNALEAHEVEHHSDSPLKPYGCGQCSEVFATPRFLRRHKEAEHSQQLPCEHCKRTFKRQEDLDVHQMVHNDLRPYTCEICGKSFTKQPIWRQHVRTHGRRPRPFQCDQCPRSFLSEIHLAAHGRRHQRKTVQCDQCKRHFTSEARLKKHVVSVCCTGPVGSEKRVKELYGEQFLPCAGLLRTVSRGSAICNNIINLTRVEDEEEKKGEEEMTRVKEEGEVTRLKEEEEGEMNEDVWGEEGIIFVEEDGEIEEEIEIEEEGLV